MQRPIGIIWFERTIFGTLALGIIQSALSWNALTAMASPAFVLFVQASVFLLVGGLALLISRRRSNFAKWLSIALFVIGVPMMVKQALDGQLVGMHLISVIQTVGQSIAYALLFTPAARHWLRPEADVA